MRYKDIEISVHVDGKPLQEYAVTTNDAEQSITCWIPSEEGKEFVIMRGNCSKVHEVSMITWVDGRRISGFSHFGCNKSRPMYGQRVSKDSALSFKFAPLQLTEDEGSAPSQELNLDALGTIVIRVVRTKGEGKVKKSSGKKNFVQDLGPVSERSKKAGAHCVAFGNEMKIGDTRTSVHYDYIDTVAKPYCKFRFRYRSRDILLAQGIMTDPAPSLPPALGSKRRLKAAEDSANAATSAASDKKARPMPNNDSVSAPSVSREPAPVVPMASGSKKRAAVEPSSAAGPSSKKARRSAEIAQPPIKADPDGPTDQNASLQAQLDTMAAAMDTMRANMETIRAQLNRNNRSAAKPEPSPITMATSGGVIDLTEDD